MLRWVILVGIMAGSGISHAQPHGYIGVNIGPNFPQQSIDYNNTFASRGIGTAAFVFPYINLSYTHQGAWRVPIKFTLGTRQISQGLQFTTVNESSTVLGYDQFLALAGPVYTHYFNERVGIAATLQTGLQAAQGLYHEEKGFQRDNVTIARDGTTASFFIPEYSPGTRLGIPLAGEVELFYEFPAGHRLGFTAQGGYGLLELHRLTADYFYINTPGQAPRAIDFAMVTRGSYASAGLSFAYALGAYTPAQRAQRRLLTESQLADYRELRREKALTGLTLGVYVASASPQATLEGEARTYMQATALTTTNLGVRADLPLARHVVGQAMVELQTVNATLEVLNPAVDTIGARHIERAEASGIKVAVGAMASLYDRSEGRWANPSVSLLAGLYPLVGVPYPFDGRAFTMGGSYRVTSFDQPTDGATTFFAGGLAVDFAFGPWAILQVAGDYTYMPAPLWQRNITVEPLDGAPLARGTYGLNPGGWALRASLQIPLGQLFFTKRSYLRQLK